jgi:hypothetical protein
MHLPAFGPTIGLLVETAGDSPGVVRQEFQPNRGMGSWGNEVTEIGVLCTFKAPFAESASITDLLASLVSSFVALPVQTGFYQWYRAESIGDSLFHLGYRITTSNTSHPMFTFLNGP